MTSLHKKAWNYFCQVLSLMDNWQATVVSNRSGVPRSEVKETRLVISSQRDVKPEWKTSFFSLNLDELKLKLSYNDLIQERFAFTASNEELNIHGALNDH